MSDVDVSRLLLSINAKYPEDIEEHFGVRNIIDQQFEHKTLTYFLIQLAIYVFGFVIPITLQMFTFVQDAPAIRACMYFCAFSQTCAILAEVVKMKNLKKEYFLEFYHYVELF